MAATKLTVDAAARPVAVRARAVGRLTKFALKSPKPSNCVPR